MDAEKGRAEASHTIGQVVEQLSSEYPDVTHSSLRFLEREGLISPARTAGGHRLFPREQVARIRKIKEWQRRRLSLDDIRRRLEAADQLPAFNALADQILEHLIAGRRQEAGRLIQETDDTGVTLEAIFDGLIRPVLEETGKLWERGSISVGQEKEISTFFRDTIANLSARHQQPVRSPGPAAVAACVEGESHELGLAMISALLRSHGWTVYYLGANVSPSFLIERIQVRQPEAVLLSAVQSIWLESLERTIVAIRAAAGIVRQPKIIVGGAGVPAAWEFDDPNLETIVSLPLVTDVASELYQLFAS